MSGELFSIGLYYVVLDIIFSYHNMRFTAEKRSLEFSSHRFQLNIYTSVAPSSILLPAW